METIGINCYEDFKDWEEVPYNFIQDFIIASKFGKNSIKDTYEMALKEAENSYKILIRLIYDLNMVCWYYYDHNELELSQYFGDLYYKTDDMYFKKYEKDKEATRFYFEKLD